MPVRITAPAKINLYLHITGKRDDGYHLLDSLTAPVDGIADIVMIEAAPSFSLTITGPFARRIAHEDPQTNLVTRAAHALAAHLGHAPSVAITLEKNIPPGAGLGGGSADAAATVRGLLEFWNAMIREDELHALLLSLGSDVPACYAGKQVLMRGTGDIIEPAPALRAIPVVLIWPGVPSSTPAAYKAYRPPFSASVMPPDEFTDTSFIEFLRAQTNDLYAPALQSVPDIAAALETLQQQNGMALCRMSGSGSACFGLFADSDSAARAESAVSRSSPLTWWVRRGVLSSRH